MSKYRIRSYNSLGGRAHQAQVKVLGLFWMNLIDERLPRFQNRKAVYSTFQECSEFIKLCKADDAKADEEITGM